MPYTQQPRVGRETPVLGPAEDLLCQDLAELHAFLVEGVDVPGEALEHDLVLEVGQQGPQGLGREPVAVEQA